MSQGISFFSDLPEKSRTCGQDTVLLVVWSKRVIARISGMSYNSGEVREEGNKAKKSGSEKFLFSCHLLKRREDSASYQAEDRVGDADWAVTGLSAAWAPTPAPEEDTARVRQPVRGPWSSGSGGRGRPGTNQQGWSTTEGLPEPLVGQSTVEGSAALGCLLYTSDAADEMD